MSRGSRDRSPAAGASASPGGHSSVLCRPSQAAVAAVLGALPAGAAGFLVGTQSGPLALDRYIFADFVGTGLGRAVAAFLRGTLGAGYAAAVGATLLCWWTLRRDGCPRTDLTTGAVAAAGLAAPTVGAALMWAGGDLSVYGAGAALSTVLLVPAVAAGTRALVSSSEPRAGP